MPIEIRSHFLKGEHAMHHNAGIFNGIWSGMAIETTFMHYDMHYGTCINPLDVSQHNHSLVNILTGKVVSYAVI